MIERKFAIYKLNFNYFSFLIHSNLCFAYSENRLINRAIHKVLRFAAQKIKIIAYNLLCNSRDDWE